MRVSAIEQRSAVRRAHLPDLLAKKSRSTVSCADLGVQLLDLALAACLGIVANPGVKRPRRLLQQLLLPGVDLVRVDLVALRQVRHRRLLPQRLQGDLRLQPRVDLPSRPLPSSAPSSTTERPALQLSHRSQFRGPCVDGPSGARGKSVMPLRGRVQPCVRPADAAPMAAGPDEVRESDPKSLQRARSAWTPRVCPIPGSTGSSSRLTTLALPLDQRNPRQPSRASATWPEPRRTDCARVPPRRSARSCWRARPTPIGPTCARAAWQPRFCWRCLGVQAGSRRSRR